MTFLYLAASLWLALQGLTAIGAHKLLVKAAQWALALSAALAVFAMFSGAMETLDLPTVRFS